MTRILSPGQKDLTREQLVKLMRQAGRYCDLVIELRDLHYSTEIRLPNGDLKYVCNECEEPMYPCTTSRRITAVMK